jgi:DNA-binding transcriptional regulator YiaG
VIHVVADFESLPNQVSDPGAGPEVVKTIKGVGNLDYPEVHGVPMLIDEKYGESIHAQVLGEVEQQVAAEIVSRQLPIRGAEVVFLRKALGLSRLEFAKGLSLSDVAVLKWERAADKRLAPINEVAVRAYFAQRLKLKLEGTFDALIGHESTPKKLVIQFGHKAKKRVA